MMRELLWKEWGEQRVSLTTRRPPGQGMPTSRLEDRHVLVEADGRLRPLDLTDWWSARWSGSDRLVLTPPSYGVQRPLAYLDIHGDSLKLRLLRRQDGSWR